MFCGSMYIVESRDSPVRKSNISCFLQVPPNIFWHAFLKFMITCLQYLSDIRHQHDLLTKNHRSLLDSILPHLKQETLYSLEGHVKRLDYFDTREKYQGVATFGHDENDFHFHVDLLLICNLDLFLFKLHFSFDIRFASHFHSNHGHTLFTSRFKNYKLE